MQNLHFHALPYAAPRDPRETYSGYRLPKLPVGAYTNPDHNNADPPSAHTLKKLRNIYDNLGRRDPFVASLPGQAAALIPPVAPPVPNSNEFTLHFQLPDDSTTAVAVQAKVRYGSKITFTVPLEGMRFVHTTRPQDEQTFWEIMHNDPAALTLTSYAVQTYKVHNYLIFNLVQTPAHGPKYIVFVAKSKKEAATFLDEAFDTDLRAHYRNAKLMQRLGVWDSDDEGWSSDSDEA
jgi:hypothetical protein